MRKNFYRHDLLLSCLILLALLLNNCGSGGGGRSDSGQAPGNDTTPPTVSSTAPANGDKQVPLNSVINATFSESMNPDTINANTFIVLTVNTSGGANVPGTVSYTDSTKTATFTPITLLNTNTTYTVTITTGVKDVAGNAMAATYSWSFTTGTALDSIPPSFAGNDPQLIAQATSSSTISLSWNAATDDSTPPNQIRYVVCQSTVSTDCTANPFPATGGNIVITDVAAGQTSLGITGLKSSTAYYFVVRAKDQVGLMDSNTAQKWATTLGLFVSLGGSLNANCGTFTTDAKLCNQDAVTPSIAIVGTTPYVAWSEGTSPTVYVRTYSEASKTWSAAAQISSNAQYPQIASNGASPPIPYITFTQTDGTGQRNIMVMRWNGTGWELVGGGALNKKDARNSSIAFDSKQTAYVIWSEKDPTSGNFQIFVSHFDGTSWVPDGASLNLSQDRFGNSAATDGNNPSIAINGPIIKAAWSECLANTTNCQLYVKTWDTSSSSPSWTPTNPPSLKGGDPGLSTQPDNPSLAFINGVLFLGWQENAVTYIRRDSGSGFASPEIISSSAAGASNTPVKGTATPTQIPYLAYADNKNGNTSLGSPFLFVKRWSEDPDPSKSAWVTEGSGPLNMTSGGSPINSSIAFSGGTAYVAWTEKGSCILVKDQFGGLTNPCHQSDGSHFQVYVKRLQ